MIGEVEEKIKSMSKQSCPKVTPSLQDTTSFISRISLEISIYGANIVCSAPLLNAEHDRRELVLAVYYVELETSICAVATVQPQAIFIPAKFC